MRHLRRHFPEQDGNIGVVFHSQGMSGNTGLKVMNTEVAFGAGVTNQVTFGACVVGKSRPHWEI